MTIERLPDLKHLAYVDCQYFMNEGGKGVTKNRLKFQYRTTRGASDVFFVPLSTNKQRNLCKKLVGIAGKTVGLELMKQYQEFRKQYDNVLVGFRQVELPSHDKEGKRTFRQDQFTICWVFLKDEQFQVHLGWNGQTLSMPSMVPTSAKHAKQSKLISYYHPQNDLERNIISKFGKAQQVAEDGGQPQGESRGACNGASPTPVDWERQASHVGIAPQAHVADTTEPRTQLIPAMVVEEDECELVDSECAADWGVWQPERAARAPVGLGAAFRF